MMTKAIAEQAEMTRLSLRFLQISANKSAVERIFEARTAEAQKAAEVFNRRQSLSIISTSSGTKLYTQSTSGTRS